MNEAKMSQRQFFFLFFLAFLALNFVTFPGRLAQLCATDGLIPLLATAVIAFGAGLSLICLMGRYPGKSFYEVLELSLGKVFSKIVFAVYLILCLYYAAYAIRVICEQVKMFMLRYFNLYIIEAVFVLCVLYFCTKRAKTFGNVGQILFYIVTSFVLFLAVITFPNGEIENMLPLFQAEPTSLFRGFLLINSYKYSAVLALPFFLPHVEKLNVKMAKKQIFFAIFGVFFIFGMYYVLCVSVLGAEVCGKIIFPAVNIMQSPSGKTIIFDRYEILMLFAVLNLYAVYISVMMKSVRIGVNELCPSKNWIFYMLFLVVVALVYLLNERLVYDVIHSTLHEGGVFAMVPLLHYLVCFVAAVRRKVKKHA